MDVSLRLLMQYWEKYSDKYIMIPDRRYPQRGELSVEGVYFVIPLETW
jgi:hypothetical protein